MFLILFGVIGSIPRGKINFFNFCKKTKMDRFEHFYSNFRTQRIFIYKKKISLDVFMSQSLAVFADSLDFMHFIAV